jgi:hypothetical protein
MKLLSTFLIGTALAVSSAAMARVAPETYTGALLASSAMVDGKTSAQMAAYPEPEGHTQAQIALNW